jgi:hypothetical protein
MASEPESLLLEQAPLMAFLSDEGIKNQIGGNSGQGLNWRYWHTTMDAAGMESVGVYIVAVVTFIDGLSVDWSAYIGASREGSRSERAGVAMVASHGEKLAPREAILFFPAFKAVPYRW